MRRSKKTNHQISITRRLTRFDSEHSGRFAYCGLIVFCSISSLSAQWLRSSSWADHPAHMFADRIPVRMFDIPEEGASEKSFQAWRAGNSSSAYAGLHGGAL
jgi:hypothetical protein